MNRVHPGRAGFTLMEVAVGLLLVGVVAYIVLALSQILQSGTATEPMEAVLQAAEAALEAGLDAPSCGSGTLLLTLAGRGYRICTEAAGLSLTPPSNLSFQALTYRFQEDAPSGQTFLLTRVAWEGAPPPPPSSPNFTASCQKESADRLRLTVINAGSAISTNTLSLSWNGQGKRRIVGVFQGGTSLWSSGQGVKKGTKITLSQSLSFEERRELGFSFDKNLKKGTYTFTLSLYVGQGANQQTYTVSCTVRW